MQNLIILAQRDVHYPSHITNFSLLFASRRMHRQAVISLHFITKILLCGDGTAPRHMQISICHLITTRSVHLLRWWRSNLEEIKLQEQRNSAKIARVVTAVLIWIKRKKEEIQFREFFFFSFYFNHFICREVALDDGDQMSVQTVFFLQ